MAFVHLHVHTEYSALDGMIRMKDLFETAKSHGQDAVAITDHGTLGGLWAGKLAAAKAGVKMIAGCEFYLANGSRHSRHPFWVPAEDNSADEDAERSKDGQLVGNSELGTRARPYQHITILARNAAGWRNLVLLNNKAGETIWHKPRIDLELIREHSEGLIVLTGCLGGPVIGPTSHARIWDTQADEAEQQAAAAEAAGDDEDARGLRRKAVSLRELAKQARVSARRNIEALIDAVGRDNVYVEIMDHAIPEETAVIPQVVELAGEYGLNLVATNDAHHTHEKDHDAHAAWLLVQSKSTIDNPKYQFHGDGYWLRTEDEMRAVRPEPWWQTACDNTQHVADRIEDDVIPGQRNLLPVFPTPDGFRNNREYLYHLLRDGAQRIYGGIDQEVADRVATEMRVIENSGYIDYFLVVHDLVKWCHDNGILTGPGRGSAAGAMVTYLLGITRVDPLRYGLLFERFLEEGRQEPPDIDIDFPQQRRGDVIQYLRDRWGADRVALIGTFGMARAKAALKDAARVLGSTLGNKLAGLLPVFEAKPLPLADVYNTQHKMYDGAADYRNLVATNEEAKRVHDLACEFEDVIKGVGIHASGVIVSAEPLMDLVPMRMTSAGWVLQWTGPEAEQVGLLKVDVLGLRNLDIISKAVEYIEQTTGEKIDPLNLPDPDIVPAAERARVEKAWRTIAEGRTAGLFQLESPKMTELAMEVAPRCLNDLSALVALYRPGPMGAGLHTDYANRKRRPEAVSYRNYTTDPVEQQWLEKVLADTFGIMVYQEQAMQLGTVIAGFDAKMRSKLRKAVSKKKADVMKEVGDLFAEGAPREHYDNRGELVSVPFKPETAQAVWDAMVSFAQYAFNRSHSATYGLLAYQTAYLKGNWPAEYAAATLAVTEDPAKRGEVLVNLAKEGIEVLAPDVNAGNALTAPMSPTQIRIGLSEVTGVGTAGFYIEKTVKESTRPFTSMADLHHRVMKPDGTGRALDTGNLRALIDSGALDQFGPRLGQAMIVGATHDETITPMPMEWGYLERAARQRRALLLPLGESPLKVLHHKIKDFQLAPVQSWARPQVPTPLTELPGTDGSYVFTIGVLASWSEKPYSRGRMANFLLEAEDGTSMPCTAFDDTLTYLTEQGQIPRVGQIVAVSGKLRHRTIEADPDDVGAEDQVRKELTVSGVHVVPVVDPPTGEWPKASTSGIHRVLFTGAPTRDERDTDGVLELFLDEPEHPKPAPARVEQAAEATPVTVPQDTAPVGVGLEEASDAETLPGNVLPLTSAPSYVPPTPEPAAVVVEDSGEPHWSIRPYAGQPVPGDALIAADTALMLRRMVVRRAGLPLTANRSVSLNQALKEQLPDDGSTFELLRDGVFFCLVRNNGVERHRAAAREREARMLALEEAV